MNELIDSIFTALLNAGIDIRIVVIIIAMLPIAEARLAIPIAIKGGLSPISAFLYGFIGSSISAPLLLVALIPLIKKLASTKLFKRIGGALMERFSDKAASIKGGDLKRMIGISAFVAVPLPLTGVWTGCAIAGITGLNYFKALISVVLGNLIASVIVILISTLLYEYINIIVTLVAAIALITALCLLIKSLTRKKSA